MLVTLVLIPFVGVPLLLVLGQLIRPVEPVKDTEQARWGMRDFRPHTD